MPQPLHGEPVMLGIVHQGQDPQQNSILGLDFWEINRRRGGL